MIYARLLSLAIIPLAGVYYMMVIMQLLGVIKFTKSKITLPKAIIPFYYFFK